MARETPIRDCHVVEADVTRHYPYAEREFRPGRSDVGGLCRSQGVAVVWWTQLYAWLQARPDWTEIRAEAERSMWQSPDHGVLVLLPHSDDTPNVVGDAYLHHIAALAGIDEPQLIAECRGEALVG